MEAEILLVLHRMLTVMLIQAGLLGGIYFAILFSR